MPRIVAYEDLSPHILKSPDPDGCWEWTRARDNNGYGIITLNMKQVRLHRLVWELVHGPIPEGLTIDHLCRCKPCCRPDHLEPVTMAENLRRGNSLLERGECKKGHPIRSSEDTVLVKTRGVLNCKACLRERNDRRNQKYNERKAALVAASIQQVRESA